MFDLKFPLPGNELAAGWGPDANPHVHFQCQGCGGLIFNKFMPFENPNYCAETNGDLSMLMSAPNESNFMNSVKNGQGEPGLFFLIMTDDWEMPPPAAAKAPCYVDKWGVPCANYPDIVTADTNCDAVPGPDPEPVFGGALSPNPTRPLA